MFELQALGQAEADRGRVIEAESLFQRQRLLVLQLLKEQENTQETVRNTTKTSNEITGLKISGLSDLEIEEKYEYAEKNTLKSNKIQEKQRRKELLLKSLFFSLQALKALAKKQSNKEMTTEITKLMQEYRIYWGDRCCQLGNSAFEADGIQMENRQIHVKDATSDNPPLSSTANELCNYLEEGRSAVRSFCGDVKRSAIIGEEFLGEVPLDFILTNGISFNVSLLNLLSILRDISDRINQNIFADEKKMKINQTEQHLQSSWIKFATQIENLINNQLKNETVDKDLIRYMFEACDIVRADLRSIGARVGR